MHVQYARYGQQYEDTDDKLVIFHIITLVSADPFTGLSQALLNQAEYISNFLYVRRFRLNPRMRNVKIKLGIPQGCALSWLMS